MLHNRPTTDMANPDAGQLTRDWQLKANKDEAKYNSTATNFF